MENPEFEYVVTWDGYTTGRDSGYPERKCCGAKDLAQCGRTVVLYRDASPQAYRLGAALDVGAILRQHDEAKAKEKAEKQVALDKLSPHDRKVLGL